MAANSSVAEKSPDKWALTLAALERADTLLEVRRAKPLFGTRSHLLSLGTCEGWGFYETVG